MSAEPKPPVKGHKRQLIAIGIVSILIIGSVLAWIALAPGHGGKKPHATMDDLLSSASVRSGSDPGAVVVGMGNPYHLLSATPVALYYDGPTKYVAPLLYAGLSTDTGEDGVSKSVLTFLDRFAPSSVLGVGAIPAGIAASASIPGNDSESVSLELARTYWTASDGAVLVKPGLDGYALAVNAVPLASYLDIPVIVTEAQGASVDETLKALGVKYTLICGDLPGYGRIWPFNSADEVRKVLATGYPDSTGVPRSILADRVGLNASYIALANPYDILEPDVVESFRKTFTGEVTTSDTGSTSFPTSSADAPTFYMDIPDTYRYARIIVDSELTCVDPRNGGTPQSQGERSYVYFGIDEDKDGQMVEDPDSESDTLHFMAPSLAYKYRDDGSAVYCVCHSDYPIYNSPGEKIVQIKATLDYKLTQDPTIPGPGVIRDEFKSTAPFTITVTVQKLDDYHYPRLKDGSSLAPYLAAYRGGLVLASTSFGIHDDAMLKLDNCGDPAVNPETWEQINVRALRVKTGLNDLLGQLSGIDGSDWVALADAYGSRDMADPMFLGIIADPYMVPWYYYPTTGQVEGEVQGFGLPSDNVYADLDLDAENLPFDLTGEAPDLELAAGRMTGWDVQDTSALLARTFFYDTIIDTIEGGGNAWKDSAITMHGDKVPVGAAATAVEKLSEALSQAGFAVDETHNFARSDSQLSGPVYEQSNFIFECSHGFYYWFVPPGYKGTGPGGGFHVANVRDMNFGPSVLFASSCVTGKVDGIPLYNALSQAFIHSGLNAYIGASRLSWGTFAPIPDMESSESFGDYVALLLYGYLTGYIYNKSGGILNEGSGDLTVGAALMKAKNDFIQDKGVDNGGANDDTMEEFNLHGDPAFNPYEPNHV